MHILLDAVTGNMAHLSQTTPRWPNAPHVLALLRAGRKRPRGCTA
jgi:hypothetical protein